MYQLTDRCHLTNRCQMANRYQMTDKCQSVDCEGKSVYSSRETQSSHFGLFLSQFHHDMVLLWRGGGGDILGTQFIQFR
ncbi:hypothetical protein EB796_002399 [Bugula neritina]|uniref:Uncharacterized protein n=1 Tax=Bugula neritina TaxID=10212 RepID=A0A7J7KMA5_BUGNE|nr:hypothetical protein EB796_002399 [Bugula neritina]